MTTLIYVFVIAVGAVLIYSFAQAMRRAANQQPPNMEVPEIPTELKTEPDPPKVFLDPLIMQLHGENTESVLFVSPSGLEIEVLVNSSAADIFKRAGWAPFRETVQQWAESPAYCNCDPCFGSPDDEMGEMALCYLHGEILGDSQFDQAFAELEDFWFNNAEKHGCDKPKRETPPDYSQSGC